MIFAMRESAALAPMRCLGLFAVLLLAIASSYAIHKGLGWSTRTVHCGRNGMSGLAAVATPIFWLLLFGASKASRTIAERPPAIRSSSRAPLVRPKNPYGSAANHRKMLRGMGLPDDVIEREVSKYR